MACSAKNKYNTLHWASIENKNSPSGAAGEGWGAGEGFVAAAGWERRRLFGKLEGEGPGADALEGFGCVVTGAGALAVGAQVGGVFESVAGLAAHLPEKRGGDVEKPACHVPVVVGSDRHAAFIDAARADGDAVLVKPRRQRDKSIA